MPKALVVEILGNAKQFAAELDRAAGKTQRMGKVAGVAGLAIAGGLAVGLEQSVKAAVEAQQSTARLDQAFKVSGLSAGKSAEAIDKAEAAGRKLGFTDNQTRDALGSLVTATGNVHKSMQDLAVAQDVARFKGVGLSDATKMMTMAMTGSQRAAKQLGITVTPVTSSYDSLKATMGKTIDATEKLELAHAKLIDKQSTGAAVIDAVNAKVHGQADAFSSTAAGGMAQFHAQIDNLKENLGAGLLPALVSVSAALATGAAFLSQHTGLVKVAVAGLAGLAAVLLAVSVATTISTAVQAVARTATLAWTAAQWLLNVALTANPIGLVVVAIAALVAGIVIAYTHIGTFRKLFTEGFNAVKSAASSVLAFFRSNWPVIAVLISGPFAPLVALATNAFGIRSALIGAFQAMRSAVVSAAMSIVDGIRSVFRAAVGAMWTVGSEMISGLINGIKSMAGAAASAALNVAKSAYNAAKGFLRIGSPSRLFHEMGVDTMLGYINGINDATPKARAAMQRTMGLVAADARRGVAEVITTIEGAWQSMSVTATGGSGLAMAPTQYKTADGQPLGDWWVQQQIDASLAANPDASKGAYQGPVIGDQYGGGGTSIVVNMPNYLGALDDAAEQIRRSLLRTGSRNGSVGLA